jgi:Negative regulator of beta-lactamase expression
MARKPMLEGGRVRGVPFVASPNYDERPPGTTVDLLVVHAISLPPGRFGGTGIIELFMNALDPEAHPYYCDIAALKVSSHFLVRRTGEILQFVECDKRAWHAGVSSWLGRERCNDFSIGIELEGCDELPFENAQYEALASLARALKTRYPIADITGHADIAPGRKTDPGPHFDWTRCRRLVGFA